MKKTVILLLVCFLFSCTSEKEAYKIMTYNIRYDNPNDGVNRWSNRKDFLSNQIVYNSPDVFGIQEGLEHQVQYLDSILVGYSYVGVGRDDGKTKGEYSAIFYQKEKFNVLNKGTFWLSETPNKISVGWDASMERICTFVLLINKYNNDQFLVFNTHFDHIGNIARVKSAKLIIDKIAEYNTGNLPVLVMGDFNLKPETAPIQLLSNAFNDAKIASESKPFGPIGTFNAFDFNKPVVDRIDYIFTSKEQVKVLKYATLSDSKDGKFPSDHLPVVITFTVHK
ncbi:endonuclease/exonuclease/phosphatase family protein [Polaribacter atrinae]|uniref:Endonuclease/exonuclease/phosphatase n=1 Tax=Polaribacter atrinae TaxID=1333662 RepID=A0A176T2X7_9FLAO|nr:endonuclease/exonuclease/phosphatase family protein [Polaribacter atrinae]OAD42228.1 endonuclease/exonuclease/phosphatase [Polaribacter atrinae]